MWWISSLAIASVCLVMLVIGTFMFGIFTENSRCSGYDCRNDNTTCNDHYNNWYYCIDIDTTHTHCHCCHGCREDSPCHHCGHCLNSLPDCNHCCSNVSENGCKGCGEVLHCIGHICSNCNGGTSF